MAKLYLSFLQPGIMNDSLQKLTERAEIWKEEQDDGEEVTTDETAT